MLHVQAHILPFYPHLPQPFSVQLLLSCLVLPSQQLYICVVHKFLVHRGICASVCERAIERKQSCSVSELCTCRTLLRRSSSFSWASRSLRTPSSRLMSSAANFCGSTWISFGIRFVRWRGKIQNPAFKLDLK